MLLNPFTVTAVAAAGLLANGAHAFLLPPEITDSEARGAADVANIIPSADLQSQVVRIDCPGCPLLFRGRNGRPFQTDDIPNRLELNFEIQHDDKRDADRLVVNGFELFPHTNPLRDALVASQVIVDEKEEEGHDSDSDSDEEEREDMKEKRHMMKHPHHQPTPLPQRLGYGLHVEPKGRDETGAFDIIEVELQILEVGTVFVQGVPNVRAIVLKDATEYGHGRMVLGGVITGQPNRLAGLGNAVAGTDENNEEAECTGTLCRWMSAVREKLHDLKGSFMSHCHGGAMSSTQGDGAHPHPHPHHPHHHHNDEPADAATEPWRAPFQERSWGTLFRYIASHILLPVFVGIVAGVSISLIGMAIGTAVVALWRMVRCKHNNATGTHHRRRHSRSHRNKKEPATAEEKSSLVEEHQEAPPPYASDEEKQAEAN